VDFLSIDNVSGRDRGGFTIMGLQRSDNVGMQSNTVTFSDLRGPLYGMLRHLKVHLVQHNIPWPT